MYIGIPPVCTNRSSFGLHPDANEIRRYSPYDKCYPTKFE